MDQEQALSRARLQPSDAVMTSQVGDELILLDLNSGIYHSLNAAGAPIWAELTNGTRQSEIVDRIVAEFEVSPATAARDVESFIEQLAALGLVKQS